MQIIVTFNDIITSALLRDSCQTDIPAALMNVVDPIRHVNSAKLIDMLLTLKLLWGKDCLSHQLHVRLLTLLLRLTKRYDILRPVLLTKTALQYRCRSAEGTKACRRVVGAVNLAAALRTFEYGYLVLILCFLRSVAFGYFVRIELGVTACACHHF